MISFATPWALLGLIAAALPLILHLHRSAEPPEQLFPAVQYLANATREHRSRRQLDQLLLLLVRTMLIVALVLAAAGMRWRGPSALGQHPPSALVLIIDNSASSAAVHDGTPVVELLLQSAEQLLAQATSQDRLWLISADGAVLTGSPTTLRNLVSTLAVRPTRLDLGETITRGRELLQQESQLPGKVVLFSDLQRSALSPARGSGQLLVLHPEGEPPANRGLTRVTPLDLPWGGNGGELEIQTVASDSAPVAVTLLGENGARTELLTTPGEPLRVHMPVSQPGWHRFKAFLTPDEFRLDDTVEFAVQIAAPPMVQWDEQDRFLAAALETLSADQRIRRGRGIRVGSLAGERALVFPPSDPALIGALNRELAGRGIPWEYGLSEVAGGLSDSSALLPERVRVLHRFPLRATSPGGEVLLSTGGDPWLVVGKGFILSGSRWEPAWSDLPLQAGFLPLLDRLLTRNFASVPLLSQVVAGEPWSLPDRVSLVIRDSLQNRVEGGVPWVSTQPGLHYFLSGTDTLAAATVSLDPRESELERASEETITGLWPDAEVAPLNSATASAFGSLHSDLRRFLLFLALVCVLAESFLIRRRPLLKHG